MSDDANFQLTRRLDALISEAVETAARAIDQVDRNASRGGHWNNAYHYDGKNSALQKSLRDGATQAAEIISRTSHLDSAGKLDRMATTVSELSDRLANLNLGRFSAREPRDKPLFNRLHAEMRARLDQDVESVKHDFPTGQFWGQSFGPALPQPPTNQIIIEQMQGGQYQIAAGGVIKQMMVINPALRSLMAEISAVRMSAEFAALDEKTRRDLEEAAADLDEEACRPAPEPARIRKWGERFLDRLKRAGLYLAEETFKAALIAAMAALTTPGAAQ